MLFGINRDIPPFYAACCFYDVSRESISCLLNTSFKKRFHNATTWLFTPKLLWGRGRHHLTKSACSSQMKMHYVMGFFSFREYKTKHASRKVIFSWRDFCVVVGGPRQHPSIWYSNFCFWLQRWFYLTEKSDGKNTINTSCAWAGGTCVNTLIFSRIISFMLFTVLLSHLYFFRRISDSQFTSWIHDFEE